MRLNMSYSACIIILFIQGTACTKMSNELSPIAGIEKIVTQDIAWKVTYFWDKDKEETKKFHGYSFVFSGDGSLEAIMNGVIVRSGTWSFNSSSSKFTMHLGILLPLAEMNDDWLINEATQNKIKLKDDNTEHLEELHLEKI